MSAFFIIHRREIKDPDHLKAYRMGVDETIRKFGGKVVVRADGFEVLEGDWHPGEKRNDAEPELITVVQFPDMTALKAWYDSDEYAELKSIRQQSAVSDAVAVETRRVEH